MSRETPAETGKKPQAPKRPYAKPMLTKHGRLQELTASGSSFKPENRGHPVRTARL